MAAESLHSALTHRLSADRTINGRLLLLLQFSSANLFPVVALALLLSSSSGLCGIFGQPEMNEGSAGFPVSFGASATGGAAWKNLCRAACVLWAAAVHDWEGGVGLTGFRTTFRGAGGTEEGSGAGWVWLAPLGRPTELVGPFLIAASAEDGLQLLQIKVSGSFPGL